VRKYWTALFFLTHKKKGNLDLDFVGTLKAKPFNGPGNPIERLEYGFVNDEYTVHTS
jgi:hypothetical protein